MMSKVAPYVSTLLMYINRVKDWTVVIISCVYLFSQAMPPYLNPRDYLPRDQCYYPLEASVSLHISVGNFCMDKDCF